MANLRKNSRKVFATSVSAAMVASAVAPAAVSADTQDFSDLSSSDYYYDQIMAMVDAGVLNGMGNGEFQPEGSVTRGQAAQVMMGMLDLEASEDTELPFSDVPEDEWYTEAVKAVYEAEVMVGEDDEFRPEDNMTRAELAQLIYAAYDVEDAEDTELPFDDVEDTWYSDALKALYAQELIAGQDEDTFAPQENMKRGDFALLTANTDYALGSKLEKPEGYAPEVEDVSANNLKTVTVEFTQDMSDNAEAANLENYTLEDANGDKIDLADVKVDGSKATLVLEGSVDQQDNATLTVSAKLVAEKTEKEFQFSDTDIPTAEDAEVIGIRTVKVTFSEPITNAEESDLEDGFELTDEDGSSYNVDDVILQNGGKEARVSFYSDFEEGTYELSVTNDLEDYASYSVTPKTFEVDVEPDEEAPVLDDYRNATKSQITLVFNEDIAFEDENALVAYHSDYYESEDFEDEEKEVVQNDDLVEEFYHTNSSNHASKVEIDGNEVTVTFDKEHALPSGSAYVYVGGDTVKDLWDNVQEDTERITAGVELDEEAPTVEEVEQKEDTQDQFTIEFNENLNEDSAEDLDNYTVLNSDDEEVELDDAELNGKTVTITFEDDQIGEFTVVTEDIEDSAGNATANAEHDLTMKNVAPLDVSEDFEGKFYQTDADGNVTITVDFNRQMNTEGNNSVLDLSKYQIGDVVLDEIDDVSIKSVNSDQGVEINFDDEDYEDAVEEAEGTEIDFIENEGPVEVEISRVEDADGNRSDFTDTFEINNGLTNSIGAESVKVVDNDTIEVEFTDGLTDFDGDEFVVGYEGTDGFQKLDLSSVTQNELNKVTFRLAEDLTDGLNEVEAPDTDITLEVRTVDPSAETDVYKAVETEDTHSEFGTGVLLDGSTTVEDHIAPELNTDEDDYVADNVVTLTFTEDLAHNNTFAETDLVLIDEDDNKLEAGTDYEVGTSDNTLVITVTNGYTGELEISADGAEYIYDASSVANPISDFDLEVDLEAAPE
ncbi:S-layer homology domain-containing protein [Tenuibacillus multivorans]|uniref:S-layer homology domain-containing protein n=1 Tax=Tenuibacillus multivorans TaxID=237069 RepID=A0A1G9X6U0_9BACI|nr:S-layer homology domain-containing protein [Tenuibacillus multivorans]GEL78659.1 hypothetical protein TMU01_28940 [Tenuibacillus multivorans]SDM92442.1 S-layer homology domain-containing protein [Tenuibacillus multivorans]